MGKRSDFTRRDADAYLTIDKRAVMALLPFLDAATRFAEPCCGAGHLVADLVSAGHVCTHMSDIATGVDALTLGQLDTVITNPPWTRTILHSLILHWVTTAPAAWLLFDSDWAYTKQARPYLALCTHIVPVGRLTWIEGTTMGAKDNCSWYRFAIDRQQTLFEAGG